LGHVGIGTEAVALPGRGFHVYAYRNGAYGNWRLRFGGTLLEKKPTQGTKIVQNTAAFVHVLL
jgi:hypothetical protein